MNILRLTLICTLLIALQACAALKIEQVKPWQKGTLAEEAMQLDADPTESFADEHIYFSKEASTGGRGVGGGGCGCN
ncbi:MAG TPA: DUF4266 domain-containing protein [Gammaproteobacteria bacterium]|nr:DUF4266 domain-containing protein [Gammaproteobacteria bacterium]